MEKQPVKTIVVKSDGVYVSSMTQPKSRGILDYQYPEDLKIFTSSLIKVENPSILSPKVVECDDPIGLMEGTYKAKDGLVYETTGSNSCRYSKCDCATYTDCFDLRAVVSFLPDKEQEKEPCPICNVPLKNLVKASCEHPKCESLFFAQNPSKELQDSVMEHLKRTCVSPPQEKPEKELTVEDVKKLMHSLPIVFIPEKEEGWISVKDMVPMESGNYIVWLIKYREDGTKISHPDIVWYSRLGNVFNVEPHIVPHTAFRKAEVTHWDILPNPPKA